MQLWTQCWQLCGEAWKIRDFNRVWAHDLVMPVWCSNQLSYETTHGWRWSLYYDFKHSRDEWSPSVASWLGWLEHCTGIICRVTSSNPCWGPGFFRLLYVINKIGFKTHNHSLTWFRIRRYMSNKLSWISLHSFSSLSLLLLPINKMSLFFSFDFWSPMLRQWIYVVEEIWSDALKRTAMIKIASSISWGAGMA